MPQLYINAEFSNWGGTVHNTPKLTYVPSTVGQIELIVQVAKKFNLSVRCSGFSQSPIPLGDIGAAKDNRITENTH